MTQLKHSQLVLSFLIIFGLLGLMVTHKICVDCHVEKKVELASVPPCHLQAQKQQQNTTKQKDCSDCCCAIKPFELVKTDIIPQPHFYNLKIFTPVLVTFELRPQKQAHINFLTQRYRPFSPHLNDRTLSLKQSFLL